MFLQNAKAHLHHLEPHTFKGLFQSFKNYEDIICLHCLSLLQIEKDLCFASAGFEDFVLQFLDR